MAASTGAPANALGDWYANLIRVGRDQFVLAMSARSLLVVLVPARGVREHLAPGIPGMLARLLQELRVPQPAIDRELAHMQAMTIGATQDRGLVATMNERARITELLWSDGRDPMEIMLLCARTPASRSLNEHGEIWPSRAARRLLGVDPVPPAPATLLQLHVALDGLEPSIWRRILVPESITLPDLHRALQIAMGWLDCHLHEFAVGALRYGTPDADFPDARLRDERGQVLGELLQASGADRFTYTYDFGDDWVHHVRVEGTVANTRGLRGPACLEGANHCPPEDVGGPPGYMDFLQALRDPAHEMHRQMRAWIGDPFDPSAFDATIVSVKLRGEFER